MTGRPQETARSSTAGHSPGTHHTATTSNYDFHVTPDATRTSIEYNYMSLEELRGKGFRDDDLRGGWPGCQRVFGLPCCPLPADLIAVVVEMAANQVDWNRRRGGRSATSLETQRGDSPPIPAPPRHPSHHLH